jgi:hypothetical protein
MPWARCPFRYEMGDLAKGVRPFATNASPLLQVNAPITAMRPIRIKPPTEPTCHRRRDTSEGLEEPLVRVPSSVELE